MVVKLPDISDEELNRISSKVKIYNGHTRKIINRSIMARRNTLHTLMAKGLNQYQAASVLGCSQETVSKDVAWLRKYYKQQMRYYIENRLPELWESCLTNLHNTMAAVAKIAEDPNTSAHDRLQAYSLMVDCIEVKEGLISDPTIIQEALELVDQTKKRIVEIAPEQSKELLHNNDEKAEQGDSGESDNDTNKRNGYL
jgi:DNA-binding CsgD family transcriptional regulator